MQELRKNYVKSELLESTLDKDPFKQFDLWFNEALNKGVNEPNAMVLSTRTESGVDSRTVLLKAVEDCAFVFYTNYNSHKSQQLFKNSECSLLFPWIHLERQVIVRGRATKQNEQESIAYFNSRPRGSQIGAWASDQSNIISSREALESRLAELEARFKDGPVPKPSHWGGFLVEPEEIEFWQGRENRLHDRILYVKTKDHWEHHRLQP